MSRSDNMIDFKSAAQAVVREISPGLWCLCDDSYSSTIALGSASSSLITGRTAFRLFVFTPSQTLNVVVLPIVKASPLKFTNAMVLF